MGHYFMNKAFALAGKYDCIKEVRGLGLMIGIDLNRPGSAVVDACREKGLLVNCAAKTVIRLLPPLNVTQQQADRAFSVLDEALAEFAEAEEVE